MGPEPGPYGFNPYGKKTMANYVKKEPGPLQKALINEDRSLDEPTFWEGFNRERV
jgi:hypothetical protein